MPEIGLYTTADLQQALARHREGSFTREDAMLLAVHLLNGRVKELETQIRELNPGLPPPRGQGWDGD